MIYCQVTGQPLGAFTVDELVGRGLTVPEAMWIVMGFPLDNSPVKLRSVDGFRVEVESVYGFDIQHVAERIKEFRR